MSMRCDRACPEPSGEMMLGRWRRRSATAARPGRTVARPGMFTGTFTGVEPLESRLLLAAIASGVAGPVPAGDEFPVNVTTASSTVSPAVAMDADGQFLVAWQGPDADGSGVYARRFDA